MEKWAKFTNAIAFWMQVEGYGGVSEISPPTFYITKTKRSRVECIFKELSQTLDLSDACLCADYILLCIVNKQGDNVVLLETAKLKSLLKGNILNLSEIKDIILSKWNFEFTDNGKRSDDL